MARPLSDYSRTRPTARSRPGQTASQTPLSLPGEPHPVPHGVLVCAGSQAVAFQGQASIPLIWGARRPRTPTHPALPP